MIGVLHCSPVRSLSAPWSLYAYLLAKLSRKGYNPPTVHLQYPAFVFFTLFRIQNIRAAG